MNKNITIALLVITVLGVGFAVFSSNKEEAPDVSQMAQDDAPMIVDPLAEQQAPKDMIENGAADTEALPPASPGSYQAYSSEKIAMAATGDVVIFFHASWCPSCRGLNSNIEENVANIPEGLTILKADYDKETELKKKYGVTTQHTLVQVDANGNIIKKWSGGSKLENLVSQLQ